MKPHLFAFNVNHDKKSYAKGSRCPDALIELLVAKGLVHPVPDVPPTSMVEAPAQPHSGGKKG